jgi:choline dehydrogenase-like flavoprotein
MTIHLFSSCPMGESRKLCAADSFGMVHGTPNLFINDASLICTAMGVNPQGTVMALARRNALHFLGKD